MDQLSNQQKPKLVKAWVDEPFEIDLWEDRTHGYSWRLRPFPDAIELMNDDYERTVRVDTADSGKHTFQFVCSKPGRYELVLESRVGWQFTAKDTKTFVLEVESR